MIVVKTPVLVVDDDANFRRRIVKRLLKEVGDDVHQAGYIDEGLTKAERFLPSVVLLDVRFEGTWVSGVDLIPYFRRACPRAEIIMMTAASHNYDKHLSLALGAFSYVEKSDGDDVILGLVLGAKKMAAVASIRHLASH